MGEPHMMEMLKGDKEKVTAQDTDAVDCQTLWA